MDKLSLPRTKIFLTVVALGACSNLQDSTGNRSVEISERLETQTELQTAMKERIKRLEYGIQAMEDDYLQQVRQSRVVDSEATQASSGIPTLAAVDTGSGTRSTMMVAQTNYADKASGSAKGGGRLSSGQARMHKVALNATPQPLPAAMAANVEMPKAERAGQCFARVFVPPSYKETRERVVVKESGERMKIVPAKYAMVEEQVLVSEPSKALEVVPATYKWVEERVMIKPETTTVVEIPATYKSVSKKVMVQPEHSVWKQQVSDKGEVMALVTVPAVYKSLKVKVIDRPASTKEVRVPAEYKVVRKQVVDKPAVTRTINIAAKYKTMKVKKLVAPSKTVRESTPAEYGFVTKTSKVSDGHLAWREILCDGSMTREVVTQLQQALKERGFNPGPIDGWMGRRTINAVHAYQRKNGLPTDDYINVATLRALGVQKGLSPGR